MTITTILLGLKKLEQNLGTIQGGASVSKIIERKSETNFSFHVKQSFYHGKSSSSIFQEFFGSIGKSFILEGREGTRL